MNLNLVYNNILKFKLILSTSIELCHKYNILGSRNADYILTLSQFLATTVTLLEMNEIPFTDTWRTTYLQVGIKTINDDDDGVASWKLLNGSC